MSASTVSVEYYAPRFTIRIDGSELEPEAAYAVRSVEVTLETNKANRLVFAVQDEFRAGRFKWLGDELYKVGNPVAIAIGYGADVITLAEGKIQNIRADFPESGHPSFTVEGSDDAYQQLMVPSGMRVFKEKSTGDIVKKIAAENSMEADVHDAEESAPVKTKRGGHSYFEFLRDLAKDGGYEVDLVDKKLRFRKAAQEDDAIVTLEWGKNLITFKPALDTAQAVTEVVVRGWDKRAKRAIEVRVRPGDETRQEPGRDLSSEVARRIFGDVVKEITDQPVNSVEQARRIAKSELDKLSANLIKGSATTIGLPELRPGVCVELKTLGPWFSGKYYLERVTHRLDENGYRTTFEGRRNAV